ncbi:MAG: hypothetical protein HOO91_15875 [Bacteroidales bacterium]|nr:hypothetical protein [Bacteroidales bacterium]
MLLLALAFPLGSQAQYILTLSDVEFSNGTITDYKNTTEKDIIIPHSLGGETVLHIGTYAYTLKFGNSAASLEVKASNLSATDFTFSEELATSTKYYWQIIASDGKNETVSGVWGFSTVSNPIVSTVPSTPIIISPKMDTKAGNIEFIWSVVVDDGGLENITYILNVNATEYEVKESTTKSLNLPVGICKWYVTAFDKDGNGSESEHITITLSN